MFGNKKEQKSVSVDNAGETVVNKNKQMIEQGLEIHTMPEKFLSGSDKASQAKKTGIIIFAVAGLFLVILIIVLYVILFTAPKQSDDKNINQAGKQDGSGQESEGEEAESEANKEKNEDANLIKDLIIDSNTVISTGSEEFLDEESATSTKDDQISTSTEEIIQPEKDTDNDGLHALEEDLLGTDQKSIDSDKDGYDDLSEVLNLYDPNGSGKLIDNLGIDEYINSSYDYSVLHPSDWQMNILGRDDSIVFKSKNNHIFQIYVQANSKLKNIETWYEEQVGKKAEDKNIINVNNWKGVVGDNGLVVYITDNNYNFVYTLLYIPEFEEELIYKNIFQAMINSFVIKNF